MYKPNWWGGWLRQRKELSWGELELHCLALLLELQGITFFSVLASHGRSARTDMELSSWTSSVYAVETAAWTMQGMRWGLGIVKKGPGLNKGSRLILSFLTLMVECEIGHGGMLTTHFDLWVCALCVGICSGSTWSLRLITFSDSWWGIFAFLCSWCTSCAASPGTELHVSRVLFHFSRGRSDNPVTRHPLLKEIRSSAAFCPSLPMQDGAEATDKGAPTSLSCHYYHSTE